MELILIIVASIVCGMFGLRARYATLMYNIIGRVLFADQYSKAFSENYIIQVKDRIAVPYVITYLVPLLAVVVAISGGFILYLGGNETLSTIFGFSIAGTLVCGQYAQGHAKTVHKLLSEMIDRMNSAFDEIPSIEYQTHLDQLVNLHKLLTPLVKQS